MHALTGGVNRWRLDGDYRPATMGSRFVTTASRTPWLIVRSSSSRRPSADTSKGDSATGMTGMNFSERAWYVAFEARAGDRNVRAHDAEVVQRGAVAEMNAKHAHECGGCQARRAPAPE